MARARFNIERYRSRGAVVAWPMSTASGRDVSGNGIDASAVGSPTYSGGMLRTDGSSYLSFAGGDSRFDVGNEITITGWSIATQLTVHTGICDWWKGGSTDRGFSHYHTNDYARGLLYPAGSADGPLYAVGDLHHYAVTMSDSDNTVRLYVDGSQYATVAFTGTVNYNTLDAGMIAKFHTYSGAIDVTDIRYYGRALTAEEVSKMYQQGKATYDA